MARVLNLYVDYNEQIYMVLVTVHQHMGKDSRCEVRFLDKDIHSQLGDQSLTFSLPDGLESPYQEGTQLGIQLVNRIMKMLREALAPDGPPGG